MGIYGTKNLISYSELLSTTEWKQKRQEILKRDSYVCQKCKTRNTKNYKIEQLQAILGTKNKTLNWKVANRGINVNEDLKAGNYWFISESSFKKYDAYTGRKYIISPSGWFLIKADKECFLNVHPKKYVFNILPWENCNIEFETYCSCCHIEMHKNEEIISYRLINKNLVPVKMSPCLKCLGKGELSQNNHIENAICDRCHGKRFEELIEH